jgi:hypothetical protein
MRVWAAMVAAVRVSRPQKVRAPVVGEFHLVGDLFEGGLDPVAPFGDDLSQMTYRCPIIHAHDLPEEEAVSLMMA